MQVTRYSANNSLLEPGILSSKMLRYVEIRGQDKDCEGWDNWSDLFVILLNLCNSAVMHATKVFCNVMSTPLFAEWFVHSVFR